MTFKIGLGQDSHRFEKGKQLVLGGIRINDHDGLEGNSDGDVVLHAICNAIGSTIGMGSISTYSDKICLEQGIKNSSHYVRYIKKEAAKKGYMIGNCSISLECMTPKIEPIREKIQEAIAGLLDVEKESVGITATSGEGLTDCGKGLGISVSCVVLLKKA